MINESPEPSLKLTPEQLAHLDTLTNRADSLKSTIAIHQTNITALKVTNAQLEQDRENLTKTIEDKKPLLAELEARSTDLKNQIAEEQKLLSDTQEKTKELLVVNEQKSKELSERESALLAKEKEHQERSALLDSKIKQVDQDQSTLDDKKSKIAILLTQI